jgi:hypothetical protein
MILNFKTLTAHVRLTTRRRAPKSSDLPIHGHQEGRFFHGFYDHYCYLPLYILCERHLLAARLRLSQHRWIGRSIEEVQRIITQIRKSWPAVRIILRVDSGFCRDGLMTWCKGSHTNYDDPQPS